MENRIEKSEMKIEIKNRFTGEIIISGDYESIKIACEKNKANLRGADLRGADLRGANLTRAELDEANLCEADLRGADLRGANFRVANLYGANLDGANLDGADLRVANLYGANLYGANLRGANLRVANLYGANLDGANLRGANLYEIKSYSQNYDIFIEICKRERKVFTKKEWSMIRVIAACRICWGEIRKKFKHNINRVFKKLSKAGYDEWEKYYSELEGE